MIDKKILLKELERAKVAYPPSFISAFNVVIAAIKTTAFDVRSSPPPPLDAKPQTYAAVNAEIIRARTKFPDNKFLVVALMEEVGELAQAFLQKKNPAEIKKEAMQVACVAIRIMEESDPTFDALTDENAKP